VAAPAETALAIVGTRPWTGGPAALAQPTTLRVEGERIAALGRDPALLVGTQTFHFENMFSIPGLIDCHVHMALDPLEGVEAQNRISPKERRQAMFRRAETMVRCGITTARDLGGADWEALELRDQIAAGAALGPRLLCAGQPLTSPGGHCHFWGGEAGTPEAVREVVERQLARGVDWVKVMATGGVATQGTAPAEAQFDAATLASVVAQAGAANRPVATHCHGTAGIRNAAEAGVRTIEHCSFAGSRGFGTDFQADVVGAIAAAGAWVSPTVNGGWARRQAHEGQPTDFFRRMSGVLGQLVAANVPLIASTDAGIPGVAHHRLVEGLLALRNYAGLDGEALLRTATAEAARALGLEAETGRLAPGLAADLVIVREDPLRDPSTLLRPVAVFARGRRVEPLAFARR